MIRSATNVKRFPLASGLASVVFASLVFASLASAKRFGEWGVPVNAESIPGTSPELNTPSNDGCPIQSPNGLSLFIASNRPGGLGGQDIWVAFRGSKDAPWGAPVNLGAPVNSAADDFCPSPARGHRLFYVSAREGACGGTANADIYVTRLGPDGWETPQNLGCHINSPDGEASPSLFEDELGRAVLYFSSNRADGFAPGGTDSDIYFSADFGPAQLAPGLNTEFDDFRPNVRRDGREVVFDSNRPGGLGGFDIWTALRVGTGDDWPTPVNLISVNSAANETRASLSWDGLTMVFGSNRPGAEGAADVYVTTRPKLTGKKR